MLSNKTYDRLRFVAEILLPALGALYAALGQLWNFPYIEQIVGSAAAVDTFLGALLKFFKAKYDKAQAQLNSEE